MIIRFSPTFLQTLKKSHVIIRKNFKKRIEEFAKNPNSPPLNNHPLKKAYEGYRSINVTSDWRAIYQEKQDEEDELIVYFVAIGTHKELYR